MNNLQIPGLGTTLTFQGKSKRAGLLAGVGAAAMALAGCKGGNILPQAEPKADLFLWAELSENDPLNCFKMLVKGDKFLLCSNNRSADIVQFKNKAGRGEVTF